MRKLDGCDDRALVLEYHHLAALRWGAEEHRYPLSELTPGSVVRHDKGKALGVFGKREERVRTDFDATRRSSATGLVARCLPRRHLSS